MSSPPKINWDDAFAYYAAAGPTRSYRLVVERYGVAQRTVERRAVREDWQERAAAIDRQAADQAERIVVRDRTARVADTLRIIDASRHKFAANLRTPSFRLTGSDFVGLIKLEQLLEGEATDRVSFTELQEALGVVIALALEELPKKARTAFLAKVRARLGAIGGDE